MLLIRRALAVALVSLLLAGCTGLIFQPLSHHLLTPDRIGLAYRDIRFTAADGVSLHGWFLPATAPRQGSVLFLHGNAQNISTHIASVAWLPGAGFDVFLFDYRGYGRSAGEPSLDGVHLDFSAALETLLAMPGVDPDRVAVFGQSLGAAIAIVGLADSGQKGKARALVVEGGFLGYRALAREKLASFWPTWLLQWPLSLTIDDRYRPIDRIAEIAPLPILIIQGEADQIVPTHHGVALFERAGEPKELWLLPDVGHLQAFARPETRRRLRDHLVGIFATAPRAIRPGLRSDRYIGERDRRRLRDRVGDHRIPKLLTVEPRALRTAPQAAARPGGPAASQRLETVKEKHDATHPLTHPRAVRGGARSAFVDAGRRRRARRDGEFGDR